MSASRIWPMRNASIRRGRVADHRVETLAAFADRPVGLLLRYIARHAFSHALILISIVSAVACALASQYAIKSLIDSLSVGRSHPWLIERAFLVLVVLIFTDNLFWRVGGWIAARAFVAVTGDIREDLFGYLVGHAPTRFADKQPGMLSSRVSATANAVYTAENTVTWNALPPCLAVIGAIGIVATVDSLMAAALVAISLALASALFWLAHRGASLHHTFAIHAASVDGELVDVIGNMGTVRAFGATLREHRRFDAYVDLEMASRQRSLLYLERLRLLHAVVTALLSAGVPGWILWLWSDERATTGDVVLISSPGFTILHGTRDLAVALAVVPQDASLFHRSLLENLRYGKPDATEDEVRIAAAHAACTDLIASLPEGLDTIVGDRGVKLSGGQRQRIAIARAILKRVPILLLDEATSSLDSASESAIQASLERLMQNRTVLAIAHRVSTLQNFDRIVVVHRGRVIDDGSPAELAARPGMYRDVLARQMRRVATRRHESPESSGVSAVPGRKPEWLNESGEQK